MSVTNRKDINVIDPPDAGESFFYEINAGESLIVDIPAGKEICYFVPTSSTNTFYTYSKDETDPPAPAIAVTSDGVINSHLLPNALNVSAMTKIRISPQATTAIYLEFREGV